MLDPRTALDEINKAFKNYFSESTFYFKQNNDGIFISKGNYVSQAINNYNNAQAEVDVIKWFDDFWLYSEVSFQKEIDTGVLNVFISVSVFQGGVADSKKSQLFRAEWDNFDNNLSHPQPHWHIYSNHTFENTFSEMIDLVDDNDFSTMLKEEKSRLLDVKRMHFAMNADWTISGSYIHKIMSNDNITKWFMGLLTHIRAQLQYVRNKENDNI